MAVKKTELYSLLWEAVNKLRGGVEPARYKDYVLTLLFFKYVSDRYKGQRYADFTVKEGTSFDDLIAAKGKKDIGDAYEYFMMKFAQESGKSKGQFNTPSEVSRTMARLLGISNIQPRQHGRSWTLYEAFMPRRIQTRANLVLVA
ncbi:type I restriction-modification system subunit M N-terminal domain-containing protein [Actinotignum urinale]|uniref:type I restriction-modification system subunit M N-terminal domain-containing protein n=2 Tax=Actinotignum urinale TaxID=190146 RepID=UPI0003B3F5DB|nr:type I restriction-modification system subunit M N-terminal domain-containing protein [Actinotignum urinale]MDY5160329.1 type I restriction-modification system subunit M N-terminal domain-containing protein [Actinotignum urinale]